MTREAGKTKWTRSDNELLRRTYNSALATAVKLCLKPYGDEVQCMGGDEPLAVGRKLAKAIRKLRIPR